MSTRLFGKISLFFLFLCSLACRDTIDLKPKEEQLEGISIQGKLVKGSPSIATIKVERVFTFSGESRRALPITTASIVDESGQEFLLSRNRTVGNFIGYISDESTFTIAYGNKYKCRVVTEGQVIYESEFEPLLPVPTMEQLNVEVIEKTIRNSLGELELAPFARFRVTTPLKTEVDEQKSYLQWQLYRSWKYIAIETGEICILNDVADASHVEVINGNEVAGDTLLGFNFYDEYLSFPFAHTYYLHVIQESLSPTAFEYYNQLSQLTKLDGNQFEPTPGVISNNLKNINDPTEIVYGFFHVVDQNYQRIRVCAAEFGIQPDFAFRDRCNNNQVPNYWVDCK